MNTSLAPSLTRALTMDAATDVDAAMLFVLETKRTLSTSAYKRVTMTLHNFEKDQKSDAWARKHLLLALGQHSNLLALLSRQPGRGALPSVTLSDTQYLTCADWHCMRILRGDGIQYRKKHGR